MTIAIYYFFNKKKLEQANRKLNKNNFKRQQILPDETL